MTATNSEVLAALTDLLGRRNLSQAEFANWLAGAANGGPNGDGQFPLTDSTGFVRMVPSPAKQMAGAPAGGGSLTPAGVAGLPAGVQADAGVDFKLLGVAEDGTPKRFPAPMIATRLIKDLPAIATRLGDEILPTWSAQRQAALGDGSASLSVGEISAGILGVSNPKISFGAKGDGRVTYDLVTTAGSNVVSSDDAPFSALDVGKTFFCTNGGANYGRLTSTITAYIDSKHVQIGTNASTSFANQQCLWGTDDTAALQAWLNSLAGPGKYMFGRAGLLPEGIFLTKTLKYGARMAIKGSSRGVSVLALIPGGTGTALLENVNARVDFPVIRDLTLLGSQYLQSQTCNGLSFISVPGTDATLPFTDPEPQFSDIDIRQFPGSGLVHVNRGAGRILNFDIQGCGYYGLYSQGYDNHYYNFQIAGCRLTGIYCGRYGSAGNDFRNFKVYFCGSNPYQQNQNGVVDPNSPGNIAWEDACNVFFGGPQQASSFRLQESWGPNMVIACSSAFATDGRFDDTGCVYPRHTQGRAQLLNVRPAIMFVGAAATDCVLNNMFVTTAVHPGENYATQALFFAKDGSGGYPGNNQVEMKVQRSIGAYYGSGTGVYAPAQIGTDNPSGYTSNTVTSNFNRVIG